jgi:hypothetical protein
MRPNRSSVAPAWHRSAAQFIVACSLATNLPAGLSLAQTGQGLPPGVSLGNRPQDSAPLDTRTLSCDALKDRLQRAGNLYVTGPQGWSETFYRTPRCEFWATPEFQYVRANDGACGLGYLCQWKPGGR